MNSCQLFFKHPTPYKLLILSALVGVGGAFGAITFHFLIYLSNLWFFGSSDDSQFINLLETLPIWYRILVPAVGGLLVGLIFHYSKIHEAEGEGVPEVMEALAVKRGKIRPWVAPVKTIASAITIGSGGSAGREGPIIQIGSAIGSNVGQWLNLDTKQTSMLLAAGAAAGIAGTFGTPIAGVIFSAEILFRKMTIFNYFQLILAAIVGAALTKSLIGHDGLVLTIPSVPLIQLQEALAYILLGVVAGVVAVLFGSSLKFSAKAFRKVSLHPVLKPAVGGLLIGLIAIFIPYIHEPATYPLMVEMLEASTFSIYFLLTLLFVKIISTSITLGSGGSGGIFAPSLLIGILLGSVFGTLLQQILTIDISIYVYALVGMAAVFAAAAHAPITAVVIMFEITNEVFLIVPLIQSCFVAYYISSKINSESIYHKP